MAARAEIDAGNVQAGTPRGTWGRLPAEYRPMFAGADYVVYSWVTPIAWHRSTDGLWVMPDVRYSQSTTRQQGKIRQAVRRLNEQAIAGDVDVR